MKTARFALLLMPLPLLLAACGGDASTAGGQGDAPSAPAGFELALAGTATTADDAAAPLPPVLNALTPEQLAARIKAGTVRLIDVRTDEDVAEGMIAGAEHIPLDRFDGADLDLSDGREVVLYCRSGRRSAVAGEQLSAITGKPATHLDGGMLAWEAAGQPVEKQP